MDEKYLINKSTLVGIADAIRMQKGTTDLIDPLNFASEIASMDGTAGTKEGYRVRYIDADGTILKEEYVQEGGTTTPPSAPNYDSDYLEFQEWNYDTTNLVVESDLDIGATYKTKDDCTYLFCKFTVTTGLNPTLQITGDVTIDWGDGIIDNLLTHTYAEAGEYIIKIDGMNRMSTNSGNTYLMGGSNLNEAVRKCYIGNASVLTNYAFYSCTSLKTITIPKGITISYSHIVASCYNLKSIVIPSGVTNITMYAFSGCSTLKLFSIPKSVKNNGINTFYYCNFLEFYNLNGDKYIQNSQFSNCVSLKSIRMGSDLISIGQESFYNCYSLKSVIIPSGVTSIGKSAFYNCRTLENLVFKCISVPTLSNTNAFSGINASAIMWVNDDIIEDLKAATNWSTYADYMQPLSTMPQDLKEELGV